MLDVAVAAAHAGGRVIREALGGASDLQWKTDELGDHSIVTATDLRADQAIQAVIREAHPDHLILSEESGVDLPATGTLWIIDPLDGTDDFSRGCPTSCVCVTYLVDGQPAVAAVFDPYRDELFTARRGGGALLNGRPIAVSAVDELAAAVVGFNSPDRLRSALSYRQTVAVMDALMAHVRRVRVYGSTAIEMCWTACGRLDGKASLRARAWDLLGPSLVVTEAGGACQGLGGGPLTLSAVGGVASNGRLQDALRRVVVDALDTVAATSGGGD